MRKPSVVKPQTKQLAALSPQDKERLAKEFSEERAERIRAEASKRLKRKQNAAEWAKTPRNPANTRKTHPPGGSK